MSDIAKLQDAPSTKIQQQILSLHAYLKSLDLEAGDELPVEEVLARIDAIEWGNEDLVEAGEAFLLFTRLWRGVALWYASIFGTGWKRCRVIDSHNGETLLDWTVAEPLISKEK